MRLPTRSLTASASSRPRTLGRPRRSESLTASGLKVTNSNASYGYRLALPWQNRALFYVDNIGELHYASQFYARMLEKLRIYPAFRDANDSITEITEGPPVEQLNRIQDPGGGRSSILSDYGKLMMITGEGYLLARGIGEGEPEKWSFVWREELRFDESGKVTHVLAPQLPVDVMDLDEGSYEPIPAGSAEAYRMWTPHPRFKAWPDSPMRAILGEAEELLVLGKSVYATATSRLVRSMLLGVPQEIAPPPIEADGDEDPQNDPFLTDFTEHLELAIQDPSSAASLAPYVLYAAAEWIDKIKPIKLHDYESDYLERELRTETIRRMNRGLDLPPEVIEGMSDANHWAAWWISDDMWRSHGARKAEQFCDDLSDVFLRPALRDVGFDRWQDVVVAYDASAVVVNPDRSKDADQAWDRGAIGYKAYRNAKNFKDDDAQTEEEHNEWLAQKKVVLGPDGKPVPDTGSGGKAPVEDGTNPGDDPGTPDGQPGDTSEGTNLPASAAKRAAFSGAAELALLRCRELAGIRLKSRKDSCPDCFESVNGAPSTMLAAKLGQHGMLQLGNPDPRSLVAGGADPFRQLLLSWGRSEQDAKTIADMIEMHAARTLLSEVAKVPAGLA